MAIPEPGSFSRNVCKLLGVHHLMVSRISIDISRDCAVTATVSFFLDTKQSDDLIIELEKIKPDTAA